MELSVAMASLLRCLWLAAAIFHGAALAAFDVHVMNFHEEGTSVFNASLGSGWSYEIHPTLTGDDAKNHITVDSVTGDLTLMSAFDCYSLHENPFMVYIQARGRPIKIEQEVQHLYVMLPVAIYAHGSGCHPRKAKKETFRNDGAAHTPISATQPQQVMLDYPTETCWLQGEKLLDLKEFLPASLTECPVTYHSVEDGGQNDFEIDGKSGLLTTAKSVICVSESHSEHINVLLQVPSSCSPQALPYWTDDKEDKEIPLSIQLRTSDSNHLNSNLFGESSGTENGEIILHRVRRQNRNSYPSFSSPIYTRNLPENEPPGYVVANIQATDNDDGDNGRLSYSMTAHTDSRSQSMFSIDSNTGRIVTTVELDREQIETHTFRVTATDHGSPPKSGSTYLNINIDDRNDHTPIFEQPNYVQTTNEGQNPGTQIARVQASDGDDGINAEIRYSIVNHESPNDVFSINPSNGEIKTLQRLDREQIERYNLIVMAEDMGTDPEKKNSTAEVLLTVLDINDNSPHFSQLSYEVAVREDVSPGDPESQFLQIIATDADEGVNAEVHFSLTYGNFEGRFRIDSINGFLSLQHSLDFETTRSYRLSIRAQDSGNPPRENSTTVTVTVVDVNDNNPQFSQNVYLSVVREDVDVGYSILSVNARDDDQGENARLAFSIEDPPEEFPFEINEMTGAITNTVGLDREDNHNWEFQVKATDHGEVPRTATATVTITVTDVNDNAPVFERANYYAAVAEDAHYGFEVLTVTATDPDEQNTISYRIADALDPTARMAFNIISQNNEGSITVISQLSYNAKSFYSLVVTASDRQYESTCNVYINITDVNNYAPVFQNSPYNEYVSEDVSIGHVVVRVSAADNDAGANALVTYSMDESPEFEINATTGEIRTKVVLDRETVSSYNLYVTASDQGINPQQSRAFVQVIVQDVNDNAPVFEETSYEAEVEENSGPQTSVITISATDRDQGSNSQVKYTFNGGVDGEGRFTIDESSGVIRVASRLDRENQAEYRLVAFAYDQGSPSQSSSTEIIVEIADMNDNPPIFSDSDYYVSIMENREPGEQVIKLAASDADSGLYAQIRYTIVRGDQDYFEINPDTGLLTSLVRFDYESRNQYEVVIHATNVPFFDEATIHIQVQDDNDNAPILNDFEIYFNNYEGYFHDGDIGQVPAMDPDVSDVLEYQITEGNTNHHLILNTTTGGIRLNPTLRESDIPQTILFKVQVSDGLNTQPANVRFRMIMVTHDMLFSSVTVEVEDMHSQDFLSGPKLVQFIEALAGIIPANRDLVYLFSVKDQDSMTLNLTFAAQRPDGSFFSSQYLQERVYLQRSRLSEALGATVLPFGDNICLNEVCSDFYQCIAPLTFWTPGGFIATTTVIFRSIHPETIYKCDCPPGFTGNYCMTEINFCYSNPCVNNGVCVQKEAGYVCMCTEGFIGTNCEIDSRSGRCDGAMDSVCKHGGTCHNFLTGGFECSCLDPYQYDGPFCDIRTRNFPPNSFMMFWSLSQRVRLQLSVSFATQEPNGLIFYNGRYNQQHDFIALEIVNSQVRFSFSTGSTVTTVSASRVGGVTDGEWHTVTIEYYLTKARIILDDCDPEVALSYGHHFGGYNCADEAKYNGDLRHLDLTGPFIVGGLPELPTAFPVDNTDFDGCIRDIYIDNELLDLADNVEDSGTQAGCPHREDFCLSDPCHAGSTCETQWDRYQCHCADDSGGANCQEAVSTPIQFTGESFMSFDVQYAISLPWTNRILFRTGSPDGVLMFMQLSGNVDIRIELLEGYLHYVTSSIDVMLDEVRFDDREWHDFEVEWKNNKIILSMDFDRYRKSVRATDNISGKTVQSVDLGGLLTGTGMYKGFIGCMKGMSIGDRPLDPSTVEGENILEGCNVVDACKDSPCPVNSRCIDLWGAHECRCDKGHYGADCSSACDLRVCQHGSSCTLNPEAEHGYVCACSELYYGSHCEKLVEECDDNWWGNLICGPCECDLDMGFESACNKTTSECYCKEHSYRPSDSDTCFPCDCYEVGSEGQDCNQETGQCLCKRGVIGRRCDACNDPYAEVTLRGCEVVYSSCPKRYAMGLWWPRTKFHKTAVLDCPEGSYGIATRSCDYEKNWLSPNLFNCTSDTFASLQMTVAELKNGLKLYPELSFAIAMDLQQATNDTDSFHGNDIYIAYQALGYLLKHESKQVGLNVTATIKKSFTKNIVEAASRLFEPENKDYWDMIQETERGTAELMEDLEAFAVNIARFTTSFSYTPEFSIVTPNIIMHHGIIRRENFTSLAVPDSSLDDSSLVHIPGDLIEPRVEIDDPTQISFTSNVAVSAFILYSTLQNLLPNSTKDDVRKPFNQVGQIIDSPVISFSIYDELANGTLPDPLVTPVILEFESRSAINRSGPQCVYWDFLYNETGGWSTYGCELIGYNRTHINCSCTHLTNLAVIMDNDIYRYVHQESITLSVAVYVGVGVAILCLLVTFLTLLGISNLHTNLNSIHINLCFVLIAAEVTFGVGISTENNYACTAVAIILHYVLLSAFGWMFVEGVHLYRMMTEIRDINTGPMTYSYVLSYGLSALIVGLAVPLSNIDYGSQVNASNEHFCWFSVEDLLIWSFAGPVLAVVAMNMVVIFLAIMESCRSANKSPEFGKLRSGIRSAGILLPLLGITWVFGLLAVNQTQVIYQYLFAIFNGLTGFAILLFHCVLDYRVRGEWCRCCARMQGKQYKPDANASTNSRSALTYSKNDSYATPSRYNIGISTGSLVASSRSSKLSAPHAYRPDGYLRKTASTTTTSPSAHVDYVPSYYRNNTETNLDAHMGMIGHTNPVNVLAVEAVYTFQKGWPGPLYNDSDSDSDASAQRQRDSMSLASSHSSDDEDAPPVKDAWKTTPKKVNLPDNVPQTKIPPVHSTPKGKPSPDTYHKKLFSGDILSSDNELKHRAELKILDPKFPPRDSDRNGSQNSDGSVSGSRSHLPLVVSQRPDLLPLKGIMKTPGSSHKGSPPASASSHSSPHSSMVRIPADVTAHPESKLTKVHPTAVIRRDDDSDGGSSNETSV